MLRNRIGELIRAQPYQPFGQVQYPPQINDGESVKLRHQHGETLYIQDVRRLPDGYVGTLTGVQGDDEKSVEPATVGLTYGDQINFQFEHIHA